MITRWQVRRGLPLQDLSGKRGFPDEGPPKGSGGPLDPSVQVPASQAKPASIPQPEPEVCYVTSAMVLVSVVRWKGVLEGCFRLDACKSSAFGRKTLDPSVLGAPSQAKPASEPKAKPEGGHVSTSGHLGGQGSAALKQMSEYMLGLHDSAVGL